MLHNGIEHPPFNPQDPKTLERNLDEFRNLFRLYCAESELDLERFCVDESSVIRIFIKTDEKKLAYKIFHKIDMDDLKVVGTLAYYFSKFRPIMYRGSSANGILKTGTYNEEFAIFLIALTINQHNYSVMAKETNSDPTNILPQPLSEKSVRHIWYELVNRYTNVDSMALLVESLAIDKPSVDKNTTP